MIAKYLYAACATGLLLAGCGAPQVDRKPAEASGEPKLVEVSGVTAIQIDPDGVKLAGIAVAPAGNDRLSATVQPTGEVQPTDSGTVQVTSPLPGKITATSVSTGQKVTKGQVLAYVDSVDLAQAQAAYQTAVAHTNLLRNQLEQQKKLAGFGSLSEQPVEDARRAASAADAAVSSDEAQIRVDKLALQSTQKLLEMGEITRKPVEDAENAFAQAQASSQQAKVSLHSAKTNLDRTKLLFEGGIYSRQQYEDADAAYKSAASAADQAATAELLAKEELSRQQTIYKQNLNGANSLEAAQSKLEQDEHTYKNDLIAQGLAHREYERAINVRKSGIPVSQALQQAQDAYDESLIAETAAANAIRLYGLTPGDPASAKRGGGVLVPVVAPLDGIVAARNMVVGQNIDTTANLVRLINLDRVYIDAQVYESDVRGVAAGDTVRIHFAALPNRVFAGKVQWVSDEINPDTRTATVRTVLANPGWLLRPGMFASVSIGSKDAIRAIAVPSDAVMQEGDRQVVYVQVKAGEFVKRAVKTGGQIGSKLPIVSGLSPGDQVVVEGNIFIQKAQQQLEAERAGSK